MADLGTATIRCTLGAGYIDTSEAERLEGEIAGKDAEIAALEAKIVELNGKIETAKANVLADFKSVLDRTATNPELPKELTTIGVYAFYNCQNLTLRELPVGLMRINDYAFNNCYKLNFTSFPATLEVIGQAAFNLCRGLEHLEFPVGLKQLQNLAFNNCLGLKKVTFLGKPEAGIAGSAFTNCQNLTTINVPWAEGEVSGAPWGARNATINYNYTGGEA